MNTRNTDNVQQLHQHRWIWIVLFAVILLTSAIRIRLLAVPLERDEGEYAYAGQLMLQGTPPYEKAYNMKMPGIYTAYALVLALFGQTCSGIHLGLLFVNAVAIILVFLLAGELFDPLVGLFAGVVFALLSAGPAVLGISANAEHFVLPFALGGILLLRRAVNLQKPLSLFTGGLLLGTAFMMKQHAAAFIVFGGLYLLLSELGRQPFGLKLFLNRGLLFSAGVFLPFILTCLTLRHFGVFKEFWFWTFDYARHYVSMFPFSEGLLLFKKSAIKIINSAVCLWILAGAGLICLFACRKFRSKRLFVTGFLVFSFLSVCPGFYFRLHYYILLLPAAALMAGIGAAGVYGISASHKSPFAARFLPVISGLAVIAFTLYQNRNFFFIDSPTAVCRASYGISPFPEALEIAKFIKQNSQKTDTVAVIGSEPEIYFYSGRHSATGFIYTYALFEKQPYAAKMREAMIRQVEEASPKFLVLVGTPSSWGEYPEKIREFFKQCPIKHYYVVGIADILSTDKTFYCWGREASEYSLASLSWLAVLRHESYGDPDNILRPDESETYMVK